MRCFREVSLGGWPRIRLREYFSRLVWECLGLPRKCWWGGCGEGSLSFHAKAAAPTTQPSKSERKWMDGWMFHTLTCIHHPSSNCIPQCVVCLVLLYSDWHTLHLCDNWQWYQKMDCLCSRFPRHAHQDFCFISIYIVILYVAFFNVRLRVMAMLLLKSLPAIKVLALSVGQLFASNSNHNPKQKNQTSMNNYKPLGFYVTSRNMTVGCWCGTNMYVCVKLF